MSDIVSLTLYRYLVTKRINLSHHHSTMMAVACTKCKDDIPDDVDLDPFAAKYPCCNKCWTAWKEYRVMVINEMRLDMSMLDHRKLLKKHEKMFVGVLTPEGGVIDYTNEENRNPDA